MLTYEEYKVKRKEYSQMSIENLEYYGRPINDQDVINNVLGIKPAWFIKLYEDLKAISKNTNSEFWSINADTEAAFIYDSNNEVKKIITQDVKNALNELLKVKPTLNFEIKPLPLLFERLKSYEKRYQLEKKE